MAQKLLQLGQALLLAAFAVPALATGRLADVTVVDRDTGATLAVVYHRGENWIVGEPRHRYAVALRNRLDERVMAVTAVDGINVVSGATAAWGQTGYVLRPYQDYQVTGWRKSEAQVAAFAFAQASDSYAARTGRADQVGVIGVAIFKERLPEPEPDQTRNAAPPPQAGPPPIRAMGDTASRSESTSTNQAVSKLGTAHGPRENAPVGRTQFERLQTEPDEVITLRYDSRANLVAAGIIREPVARLPTPFPRSDSLTFVPDPPARRF